MKILITGSSGFVGSHLVKKLSKKHKIVKYDLKTGEDVLNTKLLLKKAKGVDIVIHLAAFISAQESWERPIEYIKNNALGTLSVVMASIDCGIKKIIFFSSAAVKAKPLTPYAVSKISAEEIIKLYSDKINTIIVRPENIYGLGQKADYGYVIHSFINAVNSGSSIKIYGTGNQSRDFIYIDDVTETVEKLLDIDIKSGSVISLGTGTATKVLDLAKLITKIMNKKVGINFLAKRVEPFKSVADLKSLFDHKINPKSFIDMKSGILKLI